MTEGPVKAWKITVRGVVQGVGFRPLVHRVARKFGFAGVVKNTPAGVSIRIEGREPPELFERELRREAPPACRMDDFEIRPAEVEGFPTFTIGETAQGAALVFAPPDLFTCRECAGELLHPGDRRYRYPFINCTRCGPRYTIIEGLPYDRRKTTMRVFAMCPDCGREYADPDDRRFHAEPVACPACGPRVTFVEAGKRTAEGGIEKAVAALRSGRILGLKGIGGFHLVCDACSPKAVARLRELKRRSRKPLALMAKDLGAAESVAFIDAKEREILESAARPIVLLGKRGEIEGISPGLDTYGVMLPYAPLHLLLLEAFPLVVATSANHRDGPILKDEEEGVAALCDAVLTHDRKIAVRCDDSVVRVAGGATVFLRRARGYVPRPLATGLGGAAPRILSLGGELKNTISILDDGYIVTSQYLGDMKDLRNRDYLEEMIRHFRTLYSFEPEVVTCDLHPRFTTTRLAEGMGIPVVRVQHHKAHVFAVLAEYGLSPAEPYLGVAFDGAGYGEDGRIWGGEFFTGGAGGIERAFHLRCVPQQGGDLAAREPWRMGLGCLMDAAGEPSRPGTLAEADPKTFSAACNAIRKGVHSPLTSSAGRLFDAVAAILGLAPLRVDFEAEAAMRLEAAAADGIEEAFGFSINGEEIDMREAVRAILRERERVPEASAKFHNTLASAILAVARICGERRGIEKVILCGGVFLNRRLLEKTLRLLRNEDIKVYVPVSFSPGDEGISMGQAYYAAWMMRGKV